MQDKRRSPRATLTVSIQLVSMQSGSRTAMAQPAVTVDVNHHGALLECRTKIEVGTEIMIHNPANLQNGMFKVVRAVMSPGGAWRIGVELQDEVQDFWGV